LAFYNTRKKMIQELAVREWWSNGELECWSSGVMEQWGIELLE
jgi:hypothetical protein